MRIKTLNLTASWTNLERCSAASSRRSAEKAARGTLAATLTFSTWPRRRAPQVMGTSVIRQARSLTLDRRPDRSC
jgi:hypothetical protein